LNSLTLDMVQTRCPETAVTKLSFHPAQHSRTKTSTTPSQKRKNPQVFQVLSTMKVSQ